MPSFPEINLPSFNLPHFTVLGNILTVLLSIFSIYFIFLISYCVVRIFEIRKKEKEHQEHEIALYAKHQKNNNEHNVENTSKNLRWNKVLKLVFSTIPSDWKLAVIEADSLLDTFLSQMGFKGDNLGDKLKNSDRDKFPGLTLAWEVHNIRNKIAHEGSSFELPQREAKRVIAIYEIIFRGSGFI